ncbi:MAG: hypothetical protein AAFS00_14015 [Bacteroidota bacterium]
MKKREPYFFVVNVILLLIVVVGFGPSFFLRPLNDLAPLPAHLIIHGVSATTWIVAIVLQSYWIQQGKTLRHARLGVYFSLIAPLLVASGFWVLGYATELYHADFAPLEAGAADDGRTFRALIITGDVLQLLLFLGFVYTGYRNRQHAFIHKRAMLIASILLCQQALVRIGKMEFLMIGSEPGASGGMYATFVPLCLLISMVVYDKRMHQKIPRISVAGIAAYFLYVGISVAIGASGLAVAMLERLR